MGLWVKGFFLMMFSYSLTLTFLSTHLYSSGIKRHYFNLLKVIIKTILYCYKVTEYTIKSSIATKSKQMQSLYIYAKNVHFKQHYCCYYCGLSVIFLMPSM